MNTDTGCIDVRKTLIQTTDFQIVQNFDYRLSASFNETVISLNNDLKMSVMKVFHSSTSGTMSKELDLFMLQI